MPPKKKQKTDNESGRKCDGEDIYDILSKLMQHVKHLQNNHPVLTPQEDLAANEVIEFLKAVTVPEGPLVIKRCSYAPGRSNLIITYPASEKTEKVVSFVGCHMDVVAAAAEDWDFNPFELTREGDKLMGRGVTDCLGHVATIVSMFKLLGKEKPKLKANIVAVLIANEEDSSVPGVGIDAMMAAKELDHLQHGPLFWVDSANFGPTLATAGMATWEMTVTGKRFHSGIPQKGINPINLAMNALSYIQGRFYEDFPMNENDKEYKFEIGSTLKPTQIRTPPGSINQIPRQCIVQGDLRSTPTNVATEMQAKVLSYVKDFNANIDEEKCMGYEKFVLEDARGHVEWKWANEKAMVGVACDLQSEGYKAVHSAIEKVRGEAKPFSLTGSLPLIAELKDAGFDVQIMGFGRMEAYHAVNEWALLSEKVQGSEICLRIINKLGGGD